MLGRMSKDRTYWIYILASQIGGTLYIGITNDLVARVYAHREGTVEGFTKSHGVHMLVHFEQYPDPRTAIAREKRLKKWKRSWKIALIEESNPDWCDLFDDIVAA